MEERRNPVRRRAGVLIFASLPAVALCCELPPGTRVESERVAVSYRTVPAKIAVGEHFALEIAACPKQGTALSGRVKLDASMPEHRHGMNYLPGVKQVAPGRYRSEGWMFHMPGRWEFAFDIGGEHLTHSVRIE